MRKICFKIKDSENGMDVRDFLREFGVSGSLLTKLKKTENGITINGVFAKAIDKIHFGDILEIRIENSGHMPAPSQIQIKTIYEDEDILVADKPPFMPVHESRNHRGDTLSNAVAAYIKEDTAFRAVYRLDTDTSGLVLIAKNILAASKLAGKIKKDYYAIVCGKFTESGTIDAPVKRIGSSIIKREVNSGGEKAVTNFKVIQSSRAHSLLKINLETGRTHQIRVHFSYLGAPLLGDSLYGEKSAVINRQALHCKSINFIHPITEKEIKLESEFPDDFKYAADYLKLS
ncbi:MAG: RluA family pseudouridine synthase [Clostridiales bacterium]|nr:RluA family pseudouridine synthase [Clostridiales bacterium]